MNVINAQQNPDLIRMELFFNGAAFFTHCVDPEKENKKNPILELPTLQQEHNFYLLRRQYLFLAASAAANFLSRFGAHHGTSNIHPIFQERGLCLIIRDFPKQWISSARELCQTDGIEKIDFRMSRLTLLNQSPSDKQVRYIPYAPVVHFHLFPGLHPLYHDDKNNPTYTFIEGRAERFPPSLLASRAQESLHQDERGQTIHALKSLCYG